MNFPSLSALLLAGGLAAFAQADEAVQDAAAEAAKRQSVVAAIESERDLQQRVAKWEAAIAAAPQDGDLRFARFQSLARDDDYRKLLTPQWWADETAEILRLTPLDHPQRGEVYARRLYAVEQLRDFPAVDALLDRWLAESPTAVLPRERRAYRRAARGDGPGAVKDTLELPPTNPLRDHYLWQLAVIDTPGEAVDALQRGAAAYVTFGRYAEARREFDKALAQFPRSPLLLAQRAAAAMFAGDYADAERDLDAALKLNPNCPEALIVRGAWHQAHLRLDAALADYTRAIELNPLYREAYRRRGLIHYFQGRMPEAFADLATSYFHQVKLANDDVVELPAMERPLGLSYELPPPTPQPAAPQPAAALITTVPKKYQPAFVQAMQHLAACDVPGARKIIDQIPFLERGQGELLRAGRLANNLSRTDLAERFLHQGLFAMFTLPQPTEAADRQEYRAWYDRDQRLTYNLGIARRRRAEHPESVEDAVAAPRPRPLAWDQTSPDVVAKTGGGPALRALALARLAEEERLLKLPSLHYDDPVYEIERQVQAEDLADRYVAASIDAATFDYDHAVEHLLQPLRRFPDAQSVRKQLADFLKYNRAPLTVEQLETLKNSDDEAARPLAEMMKMHGLVATAITMYQATLRPNEQGAAAPPALRSEANRTLQQAREAATDPKQLRWEIARRAFGTINDLRMTWRTDLLRTDLDFLVAVLPESPAVHHLRGLLAEREKAWNEALAEYDRAIELWRQPDPEPFHEWRQVADLPEAAHTYFRRGALRWSRGDLAGAAQDFAQFAKNPPRFAGQNLGLNRSELSLALENSLRDHASQNFLGSQAKLAAISARHPDFKPLETQLLTALDAVKSPDDRVAEKKQLREREAELLVAQQARLAERQQAVQWAKELAPNAEATTPEQAAETIRKAAEEGGDPRAKFYWASILLSGELAPKQEPLGFQFMSQAAEAGLLEAQRRMPFHYGQGIGVERNEALARQWIERARATMQAEREKRADDTSTPAQAPAQAPAAPPVAPAISAEAARRLVEENSRKLPRLDEALAQGRDAVPQLYLERAFARLIVGRAQEALEDAVQYQKLKPDDEDGYAARWFALALLGREAEAAAAREQFQKLSPRKAAHAERELATIKQLRKSK